MSNNNNNNNNNNVHPLFPFSLFCSRRRRRVSFWNEQPTLPWGASNELMLPVRILSPFHLTLLFFEKRWSRLYTPQLVPFLTFQSKPVLYSNAAPPLDLVGLLRAYHLFVTTHYLQLESCAFRPAWEQWIPYFEAHPAPPASPARITWVENNNPAKKEEEENNLVGFISSRPLTMTLLPTNLDGGPFPRNKLMVHYVDSMCVHTQHRKSGIAQDLIEAHFHALQVATGGNTVCLFRKEEDLTFVSPLVKLSSRAIPLSRFAERKQKERKQKEKKNEKKKENTPFSILCAPLSKRAFLSLANFFPLVCQPDYAHWQHLHTTGNVFTLTAYNQETKQKLVTCWFRFSGLFWKPLSEGSTATKTNAEKEHELLDCLGTVFWTPPPSSPPSYSTTIFQAMAKWITETHGSRIQWLVVTACSHSVHWLPGFVADDDIQCPVEYYFYNLAHPFVDDPSQCLFLH